MIIRLTNIGKRFHQEWIFRNLTDTFSSGEIIAIIGPNGSGKSTLIKILCGYYSCTAGEIAFSTSSHDNQPGEIDPAILHRYFTLCSPYTDAYDDFTLIETLKFYSIFKPCIRNFTVKDILNLLDLETNSYKQLKFFSSGMKQRVKLALSFFFKSDFILLDEPLTNLDEKGIEWYLFLLKNFSENRLMFISTNQLIEKEYFTRSIDLMNYK